MLANRLVVSHPSTGPDSDYNPHECFMLDTDSKTTAQASLLSSDHPKVLVADDVVINCHLDGSSGQFSRRSPYMANGPTSCSVDYTYYTI